MPVSLITSQLAVSQLINTQDNESVNEANNSREGNFCHVTAMENSLESFDMLNSSELRPGLIIEYKKMANFFSCIKYFLNLSIILLKPKKLYSIHEKFNISFDI